MTSETIAAASQFPWVNLITAGAAVGGASVGSIFTYIFGKKNWERQIAYEKEKESLKIFREKSEELLVTVSLWVRYTLKFLEYQKHTSNGDLRYQEYRDSVKDVKLEVGAYDRIEALILLYFPELMPHLELIDSTSRQTYIEFDNIYGNTHHDKLWQHPVHDKIVASTRIIIVELDKIKLGIRNAVIL